MTETLQVPVEVRTLDEAQRIAQVLVCRYGETSRRTPRPERFVAGAFTKSVQVRGDRIPFTDAHTDGTGEFRRPAIARPLSWDTSDPAELRATVKFYDTPDGWLAFTKARDGQIGGGSVGFVAVAERVGADSAREVVEAQMHHFALIDRDEATPAYDGPRLLQVRLALPDISQLLAVTYDPELAEGCVSAAELATLVASR